MHPNSKVNAYKFKIECIQTISGIRAYFTGVAFEVFFDGLLARS